MVISSSCEFLHFLSRGLPCMHVFALCAEELGIVTIHIITPPRGGSDFFYRHPDPDFIHPLECFCDCLVSPSNKIHDADFILPRRRGDYMCDLQFREDARPDDWSSEDCPDLARAYSEGFAGECTPSSNSTEAARFARCLPAAELTRDCSWT